MSPEETLIEAHRQHRREWGCIGGVHVLFVAAGRTVEDVWCEVTTVGRIHGEQGPGEWVVYECEGGPECSCLSSDPAPSYRHFHNDVQVWPRP